MGNVLYLLENLMAFFRMPLFHRVTFAQHHPIPSYPLTYSRSLINSLIFSNVSL
jgi:hypothetical protein